MDNRHALIRQLVAAEPAKDDDLPGLAGMLRRLCGAAARTLSASGAGVTVLAGDGAHAVTAASDAMTARVERLQFSLGEGPCIDAVASRRPVLVPDLSTGTGARWPIYAPAADAEGVRAVFAFPLQIGAAQLGTLDVLRTDTGMLSAQEMGLALAFADVVTIALLERQQQADTAGAPDGLAEAIGPQTQLFQAQGMVMVQLGVSLAEAMIRMRARAYADNRPLHDVARDVVARRLRFERDQT